MLPYQISKEINTRLKQLVHLNSKKNEAQKALRVSFNKFINASNEKNKFYFTKGEVSFIRSVLAVDEETIDNFCHKFEKSIGSNSVFYDYRNADSSISGEGLGSPLKAIFDYFCKIDDIVSVMFKHNDANEFSLSIYHEDGTASKLVFVGHHD